MPPFLHLYKPPKPKLFFISPFLLHCKKAHQYAKANTLAMNNVFILLVLSCLLTNATGTGDLPIKPGYEFVPSFQISGGQIILYQAKFNSRLVFWDSPWLVDSWKWWPEIHPMEFLPCKNFSPFVNKSPYQFIFRYT